MRTPCDFLLTGELVLTQNNDRSILESGAVAVTDTRIMDVGSAAELTGKYAPEKILNLGSSLIMPGLINAHTHAAMTLLRGAADDLPLMEWLSTAIWPLEARMDKDLIRLGSQLACAEMLRTGTTCFLDMYIHQSVTAEVVEQCGIRAVLAEGILDFPTLSYKNTEEAFALIEGQLQQYAGHELVDFALAPHTVYTTCEEQLTRSFALAEKYDTFWFTHCAETPRETEDCLEKHGQRPVPFLDRLGLLSPRTVLIHTVDLTDQEIGLIAESGSKVVLVPKSNMKLASGIAKAGPMLRAGLLPGLGTDGAASNNTLNMFLEMSACALLHKVGAMDPTLLHAPQVLDMATLHNAACLGKPESGRLAPGAPADIIALDMSAPNMVPMHSPLSQVVYAASGNEVVLTMVNGKICYQEGCFTTLDYPVLLQEMKKVREWARKRS